MYRRTFITSTASLAMLKLTAFPGVSASMAPALHESILSQLANQQTNGGRDDLVPIEELEARLATGECIEVYCGTVSVLAQRALNRAGIPNRLVATMTRQPYDGDNGHSLNEVYVDDRWVVYDVDNDRTFVDADGKGISAVELCGSKNRRSRKIASDLLPEWLQGKDPEATLATWYDKVFNIPMIEMGDAYPYCDFAFHDKSDRSRLEAYQSNYVFVDRETWRELIGERRKP